MPRGRGAGRRVPLRDHGAPRDAVRARFPRGVALSRRRGGTRIPDRPDADAVGPVGAAPKIAGIVAGTMESARGESIDEIRRIFHHAGKRRSIPVRTGFPAGDARKNVALPFGVWARIDAKGRLSRWTPRWRLSGPFHKYGAAFERRCMLCSRRVRSLRRVPRPHVRLSRALCRRGASTLSVRRRIYERDHQATAAAEGAPPGSRRPRTSSTRGSGRGRTPPPSFLWSWGRGPLRAVRRIARVASLFEIASLTEPVAAASLRPAQEGNLSPDGIAAENLPFTSPDPRAREIRFAHLLSIRPGSACFLLYERWRPRKRRRGGR